MTTYSIYGIPISPMAIADAEENSAVLYSKDPFMAEKIARSITEVCGMSTGIALHLMNSEQMKKVAIPNTISFSKRIGEAIENAKKTRRDVADKIVKVVDGLELIRGEIIEKTSETKGGFDFGNVIVKGVDGQATVNFKNENIIAWRGRKPIAMAPDLICWIDLEGNPLTNADIKEGMEVAAIGIKAHEKMRSSKALAPFERILKEFGYAGNYLSIDEIVKG